MRVLLDSSALLARLFNESGQDMVTEAIASDAAMSSVNLSEVMTRLVRNGVSPTDAEDALAALPVTIFVFDSALAFLSAAMFAVTRPFWLSLGDRACLSLARRENLTVLTGDRTWAQVGPLVGVTVKLIR